MNAAQSHASLLLLAVMGVPWLIDRLFTWMERRAAVAAKLARRLFDAEYALYAAKHGEPYICFGNTMTDGRGGFSIRRRANASPSL